jgi:hypothetical protein
MRGEPISPDAGDDARESADRAPVRAEKFPVAVISSPIAHRDVDVGKRLIASAVACRCRAGTLANRPGSGRRTAYHRSGNNS